MQAPTLRPKVAVCKRKTVSLAAASPGGNAAPEGDGTARDGEGDCRIFVIMTDH
jgi:hypothetical protein